MDANQMNADVIASYLAGRLPASESDAFEQAVADHPEICRAVEQTLKFKEGLARLRERGELSALLRAPAPRRWIPYAAAASVALATLASVLWLQLRNPTAAMLFLSPGEVASRHGGAAIGRSYVLARTRGIAGAADLSLPAGSGPIELRIVPSSLSPGTHYSARLNRLDGSMGSKSLSQTDAGTVGPDGYVTIYVDGSQLLAGEYELSLTPAVVAGANSDSDRFVIRVN
jgi:hypothetical protein